MFLVELFLYMCVFHNWILYDSIPKLYVEHARLQCALCTVCRYIYNTELGQNQYISVDGYTWILRTYDDNQHVLEATLVFGLVWYSYIRATLTLPITVYTGRRRVQWQL